MRINQFYKGPDLITVVEVGPTKAVFSRDSNRSDMLTNIHETSDGKVQAAWATLHFGQVTQGSFVATSKPILITAFIEDVCSEDIRPELRKIFGIVQESKPVEARKRVTISDIQKRVAEFYSVRVDNLKSRVKTKKIARARHVAMYLSSRLTGMSSTNIGKKFNRDHSTILYAVDQVERKITTQKNAEEEAIADDVKFLMSEFFDFGAKKDSE